MKKLEIAIRIIVFLSMCAFTYTILCKSATIQDSVKYGSAALTSLLSLISLICPLEEVLIKLLQLFKKGETEFTCTEQRSSIGNNNAINNNGIFVQTLNGNMNMGYNPNEAAGERQQAIRRQTPTQNISAISDNIYEGESVEAQPSISTPTHNN